MKKIGYREIRHIVANHLINDNSTAYCMKSKSTSFKIIRKLIRYNWIECKNVDGPFVFVRPSQKLISVFGTIEKEFETPETLELQKNLIYDKPANKPQFESLEISVA
jgi:hypothetical protein